MDEDSCFLARSAWPRGAMAAVLILVLPPWTAEGIEEPRPRAAITVHASKAKSRISPMLYGQFVEYMFEGIKGGLHAELVRNRSFEESASAIGLSRYWERYPDDRNDDPALDFAWDDSTAYPEATRPEARSRDHSLRIDARQGLIARHGISQGRLPLRRGIEYLGYVWLRSGGYQGKVVVTLEPEIEGRRPYAESSWEVMGGAEWKKYEFRLRADRDDPHARLAVLFLGRGRLWVDQVSLLPGDAVGGVRRDVFDRVRELRPAFLRWPGGNVAQDYHWRWGVGPRDQRVTWTNLSWRNEPEPSDFGIDEYLGLCHRLGAQPAITVNVEGRGATAEEAAAWVEYCNGPASSRSGAMRSANGHPEPYGVRFWELGNEIWGSWVRGHSDAETYARNALRYQAAMRAVDPSIRLIAVGDNDLDWNRTVLLRAGAVIDLLAIHHYYGLGEMAGDPHNLMARPLHYEAFYRKVQSVIQECVPNRPIRLAINEWGLSLPLEQLYSMSAALYGARLMNVFERTGELIAMTSVSDLVNGWPGGIIQANRYGYFITPIYLVNRLYAEHLGAELLESTIESPIFDSTREGKNIPYLDVAASRSADGRSIFLKAVNTDRRNPLATTIEIIGTKIDPRAKVATIREDQPRTFNSFATPDAISIQRNEIDAGARFTIELPAESVSVIRLEVVR
jgi:alpha-N-arabinofuranosidase